MSAGVAKVREIANPWHPPKAEKFHPDPTDLGDILYQAQRIEQTYWQLIGTEAERNKVSILPKVLGKASKVEVKSSRPVLHPGPA